MKILIVDDEKLASSRVHRILNELGFEDITVFNDPIEAKNNLAKNQYDVIFLDIQMPEISGLELANYILDIEPNTFIIFQTAFEQHAIEAFKIGGIGYILKPTNSEDISNALKKVQKFQESTPQTSSKKLMGKRGNKIYLIEIDDIYETTAQ